MSLSNSSVLRRYTPPTCTLEIVAPSSPLSRWAGRTVATQLRFHLHFDDPRLAEEQRIHITGDRDQLEALEQAVAAYVQDLLNQSPEQFSEQITSEIVTSDLDSTVSTMPKVIEISPASSASISEAQQIHLKPSTGLNHSLFLGPLATPVTGSAIQLSVLQLFDLATALDEYSADAIALPINRPRITSSTPPAWASIAAVLTLAVGATVALQQLNRSNSPQQTAINSNQAITNDPQPQLAAQPSPLPTVSPLETLPPPPPAGSTVPIPNTTLAPIPVPNSIPASPTAPTAANSAPAAPSQTAPQALVINPEAQRSAAISRQATPNRSASQPGAASSVPVIPIPSPLAQLNAPNPGSQAAISQAPRGVTAAPQQQAANSTVRSAPPPPEPAAIDNINQVAEARQFFQRRWEPTAGVKQPLEYSLLLDVDGTIQRIEPIGQAAREQIDRTGMPLIGESFVSPLRDGRIARIRVVLAPDGKVQTFLESREEPSNANATNQPPQ